MNPEFRFTPTVISRPAINCTASVLSLDPPDLTDMLGYQCEGILWLRSRSHALLGDDMGVRKTAQLLRALPSRAKAIVVSPASVQFHWQREAAKWRPDLRATIVDELRTPQEGEICIISYGLLPTPPKNSKCLIRQPMVDVTLILDECHMVKGHTAGRTDKVRRLGRQCDRVWGATGTPMLGKPQDLWGVLVSLKLHDAFVSWKHFVKLFGGKRRMGWDKENHCPKVLPGYEWGDVAPEVNRALRTVMLRRTRADVLSELPPVQYIDVPVPCPPDLRTHLNAIYEGGVKEAWDKVGPGELPPFPLMAEALRALAFARIEVARDFVEAHRGGGPMLVFSEHKEPVEAIGKLAGAEKMLGTTPVKQRATIVDRFQAGEIGVLAMTTETGGVGIELTRASSILFIDEPYTPAEIDQAIARAHRPGQDKSIVVWRMISDHPLDIRRAEILAEKRVRISAAVG